MRVCIRPHRIWRSPWKVVALLANVVARQNAIDQGCAETIFLREGFMIEGAATIEEENLGHRDALGLEGPSQVHIATSAPSRILAIEVPMV